MSNRFDKQGNPLPFNTPEEMKYVESLLTDYNYKVVDRAEYNDGTVVSTVWLWLDHRFGWEEGDNPPIIFETMVFSKNKAIDWEQERYCTLEEAQAWHDAMCQHVQKVLSANEE